MPDIEKARQEKLSELEKEFGWDSVLDEVECPAMQKQVEDYLSNALENYIKEDDNYVVDGATITCDQMTSSPITIERRGDYIYIYERENYARISVVEVENATEGFKESFEKPWGEEVGRLRAVHAIEMSAVGLNFATILDRACLREVIEIGLDATNASIVSMGNCKRLTKADIKEILRRKDKAKQYGTCYCLIKPDSEWVNPFCMESVVESKYEHQDIHTPQEKECIDSHHKTMEWNSGEEESAGITKLSTLVCVRGGIITVEWSGQRETANTVIEEYVTLELLSNSEYKWMFKEISGYDMSTLIPTYEDSLKEVTQEDVDELNQVLNKYEINTPNRIAHFLSQCSVECEKGTLPIEKYGNGTNPIEYFDDKYGGRLGNTEKLDGAKYRGGGAIQMTGKDAYREFSVYMNDPRILEEGALYVAQNYFWESAGYYWSVYKPSTASGDTYNLNKKCDENCSSFEITQIVQGGESKATERNEAYGFYYGELE